MCFVGSNRLLEEMACGALNNTPIQAVNQYFEMVLDPDFVDDRIMLDRSVSVEAHKVLSGYPDFSNLSVEVQRRDFLDWYNFNVILSDGRSFPARLSFDEWSGECPSNDEISEKLILSHLHLEEIGVHHLPSEVIARFMNLIYTSQKQGENMMIENPISQEALEFIQSSAASYENVNSVYFADSLEWNYIFDINASRDYIIVGVAYTPFPRGFDYSKMTDSEIMENLYLVCASYKYAE